MTQGEDEKPQGYYPPSAPPQEYAQYPPQQYPPQAYPPQQYPPPQGYAPEYPPQYPPPGYPPQQYAPQPYPPAQYAPQPVPAQQFVPVVPAPTPTTDPDRFPEKPKYRDVLFAILFFIQLGGVVVVTVFSKIRADNNNNDSSSSSSSSAADFVPHNKLGRVYVCCICGAAAAFLFSVIWLGIMKKFARQLIYFTLFASIVWCVVLAIVAFMLGSVAAGIVFVLLALLSALCYYFWRSRIPFATAVLQTVATVLQTYPAPTYYAYTSLIVQAVWIAIWILAFTWVQTYDSAPAAGLMIFLIFSFYWTSQVIKNVVHVTASGLYATWYFLSGVGMPGNPTHKAFKRAVTTSFGSICLGSLLVAILKTLRQLVDGARRNNNNIFFCLLSCILNILDNLLQYFNMYAFAQVAIYGKKYCDAAKDTWELIKDRGFAAIINDNLISGVLTMGAILGGASAAFVGALVAAALLDDYWVGIAFICFLLGIALVMVTMEVVESGVCTIFVCFAMDPHALQRNDPELYNKFVTTYHGIKV